MESLKTSPFRLNHAQSIRLYEIMIENSPLWAHLILTDVRNVIDINICNTDSFLLLII